MSLPQTYQAIFNSGNQDGKPQLKEIPLPKPGKNQVLVKIEYVPINPTDLLAVKTDFYNSGKNSSQVGSEGSGIIVEVGEDLANPFKVGDRVHVLLGTWGEYALFSTEYVFHIQGDLSLEEAASHIINPATVYYMGVLAQKEGHKAAIHTAGSSALGKMLIRYFKHIGIKLINIVRRDEYIEELQKEGADYVLNSNSADFEQKLKELAEKEKATIAFEAVAGDFTGLVLRAMPRKSTVYLYGCLSSFDVKVEAKELWQRKAVKGLLLFDYFEDLDKNEHRKVIGEVHSLLATVFKSKVQKVFNMEEVAQAIDYYNQNSSKGKILIKFN